MTDQTTAAVPAIKTTDFYQTALKADIYKVSHPALKSPSYCEFNPDSAYLPAGDDDDLPELLFFHVFPEGHLSPGSECATLAVSANDIASAEKVGEASWRIKGEYSCDDPDAQLSHGTATPQSELKRPFLISFHNLEGAS